MIKSDAVLRVTDLKVHFPLKGGGSVHAVDGISFDIAPGVAFGLVGESGSGKTTAAQACARLVELTSGTVELDARDITALAGSSLKEARKDVQFVFQDPYASLNPRQRVGAIVRRPLELMKIGTPEERERRVAELFEIVGLRPEQQQLFPHQFSGGQRQRVGIARALASSPKLIICDEPVSALDVAIQAQVLNLLSRLKSEFNQAYLFISHDLAVVQHLCDQIAVMYLGQIVEIGRRQDIFGKPTHPYTLALISAVPSLEPSKIGVGTRMRLKGDPPSPINLPQGCRFAGRCEFARDICTQKMPELRHLSSGHAVSCHRAEDPEIGHARANVLSSL
jgi:peptide/nickel transport system ATP-binding protein